MSKTRSVLFTHRHYFVQQRPYKIFQGEAVPPSFLTFSRLPLLYCPLPLQKPAAPTPLYVRPSVIGIRIVKVKVTVWVLAIALLAGVDSRPQQHFTISEGYDNHLPERKLPGVGRRNTR